MLTAIINWLGVHEDPNMPDELKLGNLDRLDGITVDTPTVVEVAA